MTKKAAREEYKLIHKHRAIWRAFGNKFGWRLVGWTDLEVADFFVGKDNVMIEIPAVVRQSLERGLLQAKKAMGKRCANFVDTFNGTVMQTEPFQISRLMRDKFKLGKKKPCLR